MSTVRETLNRYASNIGSLLETDGKWSAMRFMSMFAVIVPISVWAVISIVNWYPAQLPAELSAIVLFGLGGKALQSKYEIRNARESVNDLINMGKPVGSEYNNQKENSNSHYNNQYSLYNDDNNDIPDNSHNFIQENSTCEERPQQNIPRTY